MTATIDPATDGRRPRARAPRVRADRLADDDQPRRPAAELAALVPVARRRADRSTRASARRATTTSRERPLVALQPQHRCRRRRVVTMEGDRPDRRRRRRRRPRTPRIIAKYAGAHRRLRLDGRVLRRRVPGRRPGHPDALARGLTRRAACPTGALALAAVGAAAAAAAARVGGRATGRADGAPALPDDAGAAIPRVASVPALCTSGCSVADLHADSLLWGRDLLRRSGRGQVDVPAADRGQRRAPGPRREHEVAAPPQHRAQRRPQRRRDAARARAAAGRRATWRQPARAGAAPGRPGRRHGRPLGRPVHDHPLAGRPRRRTSARRDARAWPITAGLLAIEGAHALDGDPANVEVVADAGFRMMSPSHFFDNAFGGSAHGIEKGGLTAGRPRDGRADGGARR